MAERRKAIKDFRKKYPDSSCFIWKVEGYELEGWMKDHQEVLIQYLGTLNPPEHLWKVSFSTWYSFPVSYEGITVTINWDADRRRGKVLEIVPFKGEDEAGLSGLMWGGNMYTRMNRK